MSKRIPTPPPLKVSCRICQWSGKRVHRTGHLAGNGYGLCPICLKALEPSTFAAHQVKN